MNKRTFFKKTLLSTAILAASFQVSAGDDVGMIESLTDFSINNTSFMQKTGFEVGLWASGGITYASHNRDDRNNSPISFNDRNNEFLLNQLNLYIERAVKSSGDEWDFGGRMDFMFGTDAQNTQSAGWDGDWTDGSYYDVAMPQLYGEIYMPFGNGITAKFGHFYTSIGYEVVPAPDNFFYSHAYTMLYAEPFTHNGVTFSYDINKNFSINAGAVVGWDNVSTNGGAWDFLGGVNWTSDDEASAVAVQLITGETSDTQSGNTTMYSIVASHDFGDKFHYVFQHDFGTQNGLANAGAEGNWFGINQYITYDIMDQLSVGLRAEWFNDKGGAGRVNAVGANYLAASFGLNYTPVSWFTFRPEVRLDWADERVFNQNVDNGMVSIAMDMVVRF